MSTPTEGGGSNQGWSTSPPPPPPPGSAQPDYSQVEPNYGQPYPGAAPTALAGFWIRFAGAFIDGIILGIVAAIIGALLGMGSTTRSGLSTLLGAVYFTYFHASTGQSVGQKLVGIKVVDADTGGTIDYGRAFIRWLVSIVSGAVIALGYLWMLWDPKKQTWHDKAARSLVVKA